MLLVQKALQTGEHTLASLNEKLHINATRHEQHQNLVLLKYNQIDSPMSDPLVQECRGLILDAMFDWKVVAHPFHKFFNLGEPNAAVIDWSSANVYEKVDGSIATLYNYGFKWEMSSSGMPDGGGEVNGFGITFRELFWKTWHELGMKYPTAGEDDEFTFMFELTSPQNRIVVRQETANIVLLAVRDRITGQEVNPHLFSGPKYNWQIVKKHDFRNQEEVVNSLNNMNGLENEGYVVCDRLYNRVKIKCPDYLRLHRLRGNGALSPKRVLDVIRIGESDEILASFGEWKPFFDKVQVRYDSLINELNNTYDAIKGLDAQKDFALEAVKHKCSGALFQLRAGRVANVKQFLAEMVLDNLADALELKTMGF
jgi:hypothetical protein